MHSVSQSLFIPIQQLTKLSIFFLRESGILATGVKEVPSVGCCFIVFVKSDMFTVNKISFKIHFVYSDNCQMQGCKKLCRQDSEFTRSSDWFKICGCYFRKVCWASPHSTTFGVTRFVRDSGDIALTGLMLKLKQTLHSQTFATSTGRLMREPKIRQRVIHSACCSGFLLWCGHMWPKPPQNVVWVRGS